MVRAGCISSLDGKARNTHSTLAEKALGGIRINFSVRLQEQCVGGIGSESCPTVGCGLNSNETAGFVTVHLSFC